MGENLVPPSLAQRMLEWRSAAKMWKPWPYQGRSLEFMLAHNYAGLLLDPGMGKTSVTLAAMKILLKKKMIKRALVIAPLRPVYDVWPQEMCDWKDFHSLGLAVLHGGGKEKVLRNLKPEHQVCLINPEGLQWLMADKPRMKMLDADMLVVDECFAAETLVSTPKGRVPIDLLQTGDLVCNEAGTCAVKQITKRAPVNGVVEIKIGNEKIRCTEDHPFFTELGWLPAKCLEGRRLLSNLEVRALQCAASKAYQEVDSWYWADLLQILRAKAGMEDGRRYMADKDTEDDEMYNDRTKFLEQGSSMAGRSSCEAFKMGERPQAQLEEEGRKWPWTFRCGDSGEELSAKEVRLQLSCKIGWTAAQLSYLLQSRLWRPDKDGGLRGGWKQPPLAYTEGAGCEEGEKVKGARVASVSYLKRGSIPFVYNLEVETCPHFEVAGCALVHNSSKFKAPNTQRFRVIRRHLSQFKRRYILTGSPRPRNYMDLWSQIFLLDQGDTLGTYISRYRNTFFFPTGFEMREWAPLPDAPKRINELVAPLVLRLDAKDYLKLPHVPPDRIHRVELPKAVRTEYDRIEDSLMSTLFTSPLVNSAGARSKCAQIANGSVYIDSPALGPDEWRSKVRPVKVLHEAKVEALTDLYDELQGEPLLVSIGYHHDVTAIRRALGKDIPCINGGTPKGDATRFIADWNAGKLPLLLGHPASMGHGLNLQGCGCRHVAFFDIPDDYDLFDQMFRRVWRQGNKGTFCFRHIFLTTDTVDEAKLINLRRKGSGQRDFLNAMKEYADKRKKK